MQRYARVRVPAVLLAIPLLTGAAAAVLCYDYVDPRLPLVCAAGAALAILSGTASALQDDVGEACLAILAGALLAGLALGADAARRAYLPPLLDVFETLAPAEPIVITGILREDAAPGPAGTALTLEVTKTGRRSGRLGGIRIAVGGAQSASRIGEWRAGRTIRAPVFLRRPSAYLNPGTPDDRRPLARRGIVLVGSVKSAALIEVLQRGSVVTESAAALRSWTRARIAAHMQPYAPTSAALATAVLIGDRTGLPEEDERRLREAGTYHVIAISGGNVAILAALTLLIGRAARVPPRAAAVGTAALLVFFGMVAGGAASVARAVTVAVIVLGARALDHRAGSLNALAVAAGCAVAVNPCVVLDGGFILSFGATLGILLGVPVCRPAWTRDRAVHSQPDRWGRHAAFALTALFAATLCAGIALAPAGAAMFGRIPIAGLVLNFAAIPLMTVVQLGGLVIATTGPWLPGFADAAALVTHAAAEGLLRSARLVDVAPWSSLAVQPPAWWLIAAYYGSALALLAPRWRRAGGLALAAVGAVMIAGPAFAAAVAVPGSGFPLRVAILDVGQGDATAVLLPSGRRLLVDAGGIAPFSVANGSEVQPAFDVGERVVLPALGALRVGRLGALVITHGDPDHLLGAGAVLRELPVSAVWEGVPVPPHAALRRLSAAARLQGLTWRTVQAGDVERDGDVEIRVLHPPLPEWERQRVRNDDSIVLELRLGRVSIVLPGDIGREGERAIADRFERGRLVVLKAPHHGSATSSTPELLAALRPSVVVFSAGRDNRFGHPHPAVLARYQAIGSAVFSTATDGAIFVDTDGTVVEVWGWGGRRVRLWK